MIGSSIKIKGEVSGNEDLTINGAVEGTINLGAHKVSVGESGQVTADIRAKVVLIDGEVTGDINGSEKVVITKTGHVRGNIVAPRVTLEDGAVFKGSIDMDPGESGARAVPLSQAAPAKPATSELNVAPSLGLKSG